jgi:hypothetical protein
VDDVVYAHEELIDEQPVPDYELPLGVNVNLLNQRLWTSAIGRDDDEVPHASSVAHCVPSRNGPDGLSLARGSP